MNPREKEKARRERDIFVEFAKAAKLDLEPDSVKSERPRKPDISCRVTGRRCYFELAEIADEEAARDHSIHLNDDEIYGGRLSHVQPLKHVVSAKASKQYCDLDGPLELLFYYEKQVAPYFDLTIIPANMGPIVNQNRWTRIWAYDTWKKTILWTSDGSHILSPHRSDGF